MDDVHAYMNIENYDTLRVTYILVYVRTWVLQENKLITNIHVYWTQQFRFLKLEKDNELTQVRATFLLYKKKRHCKKS